MKKNSSHLPVLLQETLHHFQGCSLKVFFDGTLGAGGHAAAILAAHPEIECYIGCDQDPQALALAEEKLQPWKEKIQFVHANFRDLDTVLAGKGMNEVDGFFLIWGFHRCS